MVVVPLWLALLLALPPRPSPWLVTHGDITKGVSILGAVFQRNVVSVETSSYAVQFSYATSTAPSNDTAVTYWKNNHLWGATTSGVYSDSNKVATHSRNNDARSSWYGATVAVVSGSCFYTDVLDANGITNHKTEVDFTGPVYINNGTGLLQLEGTAESFLSLFVNGTQHGWFRFSPGGNKNLAVKNTYSTGGLYLQTTGGGVIHLNGANVTLGPTDFSAAGTLSVQDSTPATGVLHSR